MLELSERSFHRQAAGVHGYLHTLWNLYWRFAYAGHRLGPFFCLPTDSRLQHRTGSTDLPGIDALHHQRFEITKAPKSPQFTEHFAAQFPLPGLTIAYHTTRG
jgi:hypothetical protein